VRQDLHSPTSTQVQFAVCRTVPAVTETRTVTYPLSEDTGVLLTSKTSPICTALLACGCRRESLFLNSKPAVAVRDKD